MGAEAGVKDDRASWVAVDAVDARMGSTAVAYVRLVEDRRKRHWVQIGRIRGCSIVVCTRGRRRDLDGDYGCEGYWCRGYT